MLPLLSLAVLICCVLGGLYLASLVLRLILIVFGALLILSLISGALHHPAALPWLAHAWILHHPLLTALGAVVLLATFLRPSRRRYD